MSLGDVQAVVVVDLLNDVRKPHGGLAAVAHPLGRPPLRVGRCVGAPVKLRPLGLVVFVQHGLGVARVLCNVQRLVRRRVQLLQDLRLPHPGVNQLLGLGKGGSRRFLQLGNGRPALFQPPLRGLDHGLNAFRRVLGPHHRGRPVLQVQGAAVLRLALQQEVALGGHQQPEARKAANLHAALRGRVQIQLLLRRRNQGRSCGLPLGVGLAAHHHAELRSRGVLAACKVAFQVFQRHLVRGHLPPGLLDPVFRLGHFLGVGPLQRLQPGDLLAHLELLNDQRVVAGDGADLCGGHGKVAVAVRLTSVVFARHDLVNEGRLPLQVVPLAAVKGLLGHVGEYRYLVVLVALPQGPALVLLQVAGAVGGVQLVHGNDPILGVHARAHRGRGSDQHPHLAVLHGLKQLGLGLVGVGVVDKGDLFCRDPSAHQQILDVLIEGDAPGRLSASRRAPVAENQLRALPGLTLLPDPGHILHAFQDLAPVLIGQAAVNQALGIADFFAVVEDLKDVILALAFAAAPQGLGPLAQLLHELLLEGGGVTLHNRALAPGHLGDLQVGQLRSVYDHVCERPEHLLHLAQVLVLGKALLQLVAVTAGLHLADRHHVAELVGPGVEVGDALGLQQVGLQVSLHGVKLHHAVHYRGGRGEHHAPPAVELLQPPHFHVQIQAPLAAALVAQVGNALHLRGVEQVLEVVGLVHEQGIHAQLLKVYTVLVLLAAAQLPQFGLQAPLAPLHVPHGRVFLPAGPPALQNGLLQLVNLLLIEGLPGGKAHGYLGKLLIGHDHRVIVSRGDPVGEHLPVGRGEVAVLQRLDLGRGEVGEKLIAPLGHQVLRHDEKRLLHNAQLPQLHGGCRHFISLARPHPVGQQRVAAAVDDPLHRVQLVGPHGLYGVHAVHRQAAAVVVGRHHVVEDLVVKAAQLRSASLVLPKPGLELAQHLLQLLLGRRRGLAIHHPLIAHRPPDGEGAVVQRRLQNVLLPAHKGPVARSPGGDILRAAAYIGVVDLHEELAHLPVVGDCYGGHPVPVGPAAAAAHHFRGELAVYVVRDPGGSQPYLDLVGGNVGGHHGLQGLHIPLVAAVRLGQSLRVPQLGPHIAGEVLLRTLQSAVPGQEGKPPFQKIRLGGLLGHTRQLGDPCKVGSPVLVQHHRQRLFRVVRMGHGLDGGDGVLGEQGRLLGHVGVLVVVLQGQKEGPVCVLLGQLLVFLAVQNSVFLHKGVVLAVQRLAGCGNLSVAAAVQLQIQQLPGGVPHGQHAADPLRVALGHAFGLCQLPVLVPVELAVLLHQAAGPPLGGGLLDLGPYFLRRLLHRVGHVPLDFGHCPLDLGLQAVPALQGIVGHHRPPVLALAVVCRTQHHLRVFHKVFVLVVAAPAVGPFPGLFAHLQEGLALVGRPRLPLLEHQNVRYHAGARPLEGRVGQAHRADQVGLLHEVGPGLRTQGVHRAAAGDQACNAAGPQRRQALGDEVIVNGLRHAPGIGPVGHGQITEGHVADHQIHVSLRDLRRLKALHPHVRVGVEVLGDAARDLVQLHRRPALHALPQLCGHGSQEAAHACRRLQQPPAGKAQLGKAVVHALDHRGLRVVGVQDRTPGRLILVLVQQLLQLLILLGPVRFLLVKHVGKAAPSCVPGQDLLLLGRGKPPLRRDAAQGFDGRHVGAVPALGRGGDFCAALGGDHVVLPPGLFLVPQHLLLRRLLLRGGRGGRRVAYFISNFGQFCRFPEISFGIPLGYTWQVTVPRMNFLHWLHFGTTNGFTPRTISSWQVWPICSRADASSLVSFSILRLLELLVNGTQLCRVGVKIVERFAKMLLQFSHHAGSDMPIHGCIQFVRKLQHTLFVRRNTVQLDVLNNVVGDDSSFLRGEVEVIRRSLDELHVRLVAYLLHHMG